MQTPDGAIEREFWKFHRGNPDVYVRLAELARRLVARGHRKIGIGMLFEVLRWHHAMTTQGDADGFKLNNNYRALYARLLMEREPDLADVFELRRIRSSEPFRQQPVAAPVGHVAPPRYDDRVSLPDAARLF